jgi:hypothetical protein
MAKDRNEDKQKVQGEGDKEADRHYREHTREFVESGKVDEAAERARDQDPEEARKAEEAGRRRAKEMDPDVHRDYDKPTK